MLLINVEFYIFQKGESHMTNQTETWLANENKNKAVDIWEFTHSLDTQSLHDFYQFIQGVKYGASLVKLPISSSQEQKPAS